jgi:iron complex outermembrane receptor protein
VKSFVTGATTPNNQSKTSPRYGVLWKVNPEISLYASYNESFTPASGAGSVQGVPFPSPTAEQTEVGMKFELLNKRLFGGVAVFENIRRNQTTVDVLNPGFSVATGEISSEGSEFDVGVSLTDSWQVIAAVGFQKARTTKDNTPANVGLEQPNVPNQMASFWTKYQVRGGPVKGLSLGLGVNYVGGWGSKNGGGGGGGGAQCRPLVRTPRLHHGQRAGFVREWQEQVRAQHREHPRRALHPAGPVPAG